MIRLLLLATCANGLRIPAFTRRTALGVAAAGLNIPLTPPPAIAVTAPPPSLCDPLVSFVKSAAGQEIALVGTAHISEESVVLVRRIIQELKPDTVMIELDPSRAGKLMARAGGQVAVGGDAPTSTPAAAAPAAPQKPATFGMGQVVGRLFKGDFEEAGAQAVGVGLSSMYKQLDSMGFQSGGEFVAAVEEADKVGAQILLGDRDARVTVRRLRDALAEVLTMPAPAGGGSKPPPALMAAASNNDFTKENVMSTMAVLKQRETVRELSAYLKQEVPPLYNALIAERDAYMANSILRSPGRRVVAVVGLAHVDGIEANVLQGGSRGVKPKACKAV